ncbi:MULTISPECIES: sigma-54-dependent transcriptional regulator [unclassified Corallococcus]|uniref:sigma-54-dependent transcriptional regulator n=1 Tax=unclassified Corallococcus TaxID=2685029 RepID=UPI001A8EA080|nr:MULTISPECIES: sigma-54 dependent transcriptional regulator [unclassified Corallococcus]MBN9686885.1 sigma-54-dependent Fis family transcriptional regulator [Corallococcus sp. NCSPR001]WAS89282.1 sigma-54 dependent transcriptional regulator [Corallococcus sp. NCRR]
METLLIVDDDVSLLETLTMHFEEIEQDDGQPRYQVVTATSAAAGLKAAQENMPSVVILDMMLPDRTGLEIIEEMKTLCGDARIILVTAYHDMETTIRAMKAGAFDYIHKPFPDPAALDLVVERALEYRQLSRRADEVHRENAVVRLGDIVGTSPSMQQLVKEIGKVAGSTATVLINGESGTGKELIARVIHNYSYDEPRPFIGINCSAIVDTLLESELFGHEKGAFTGAVSGKPGKFELAEDGTVFLDEIGDMSLMLQAKLLRVLQEREFERVGGVKRVKLRARVIAATHRTLADEVDQGRFREDLYQRLKVITLVIPPLRERREDIPPLVKHLLERINEKVHKRVTRVPHEVMERLTRLPWRGNVRELENVLTRAVVLAPGDVLRGDDLPALEANPSGSLDAGQRAPGGAGGMFAAPAVDDVSLIPTLEEAERQLIARAMAVTKGHKGRTCQILGISRPTLERKLQKFGLAQGHGPQVHPYPVKDAS